eukprot:SAG22_NODE_94_length_20824_cov_230.693718_20_plen_55_part_00
MQAAEHNEKQLILGKLDALYALRGESRPVFVGAASLEQLRKILATMKPKRGGGR